MRRLKQLLAALLCRFGLLALARWIRIRILGRPRLLVLCYHRVSDSYLPFGPVGLSPTRFHQQLGILARSFDLVPLRRVAELMKARHALNRDILAITFDDGYLDNYAAAAPILKEYGVPATFFVASQPLVQGTPSWLDQLGGQLEPALAGRRPELSFLLESEYRELLTVPPSRQAAVIGNILQRLLGYDSQQIREILATVSPSEESMTPNSSRQTMSVSQLHELDQQGHEIGAHTVSHLRLSRLSAEECQCEVVRSVEELQAAGFDIKSFAYPFGHPEDIGETAVNAVRRAGVGIAVTVEDRFVSPDDNTLLIPRIAVGDQPATLLLTRLERLSWARPCRKDAPLQR